MNHYNLNTEKNLRKKLPYLPGIARQMLKVSLIHGRFYYFHLTLRIYATFPYNNSYVYGKNNKYSYLL